MQIDTARLTSATKRLLSTFVSLGAIYQVPAVNEFIGPLIAHHPHLLSVIGVLVPLWLLLHNPEVAGKLGITTTTEVTAVTTHAETVLLDLPPTPKPLAHVEEKRP